MACTAATAWQTSPIADNLKIQIDGKDTQTPKKTYKAKNKNAMKTQNQSTKQNQKTQNNRAKTKSNWLKVVMLIYDLHYSNLKLVRSRFVIKFTSLSMA
jgi:hypothetical protein